MKCLILYISYSGNTEEIAEHIQHHLQEKHIFADRHEINKQAHIPSLSAYDLIFIGTFTWDYGLVPDELADVLYELKIMNDKVAVFGSGDTQFGGDALYCRAVDVLRRKFNSKWEGLKIEQSPRGSQEKLITQWVERVLEDVEIINES